VLQVPRLTRVLLRFLILPAAVVLAVTLVVQNPGIAAGAASRVLSCAPVSRLTNARAALPACLQALSHMTCTQGA